MTEKSLFERNMEMWEKFVNQNMDLMFKSMEKAMESQETVQAQVGKAVDRTVEGSGDAQDRFAEMMNKARESSEVMQEQVAQTVSAVISAQAEATLVALRALERQVETVSKKMDELLETTEEE